MNFVDAGDEDNDFSLGEEGIEAGDVEHAEPSSPDVSEDVPGQHTPCQTVTVEQCEREAKEGTPEPEDKLRNQDSSWDEDALDARREADHFLFRQKNDVAEDGKDLLHAWKEDHDLLTNTYGMTLDEVLAEKWVDTEGKNRWEGESMYAKNAGGTREFGLEDGRSQAGKGTKQQKEPKRETTKMQSSLAAAGLMQSGDFSAKERGGARTHRKEGGEGEEEEGPDPKDWVASLDLDAMLLRHLAKGAAVEQRAQGGGRVEKASLQLAALGASRVRKACEEMRTELELVLLARIADLKTRRDAAARIRKVNAHKKKKSEEDAEDYESMAHPSQDSWEEKIKSFLITDEDQILGLGSATSGIRDPDLEGVDGQSIYPQTAW